MSDILNIDIDSSITSENMEPQIFSNEGQNEMAHFQSLSKSEDQSNTPHEHSTKLHSCRNAWKPLYKNDQGIGEKEKLKRNVQAVLNKLTFQKFKILLSQLKKLNINTVEDLELLVNLIYENAINEPHFCGLYVNLCKHLAMKQPFDNAATTKEFCKLLLNKCEVGFVEQYPATKDGIHEKLLLHSMQESKKIKSRRIGNIRFIGELFKVKIISADKLLMWTESLLLDNVEENLEFFFWLMKTAGKELESQEKDAVNVYFNQVLKVIDDPHSSSRIRFLLQDIVDLRENNWIPRRLDNLPRTIDEIHQEAAVEFQRQSRLHQNPADEKLDKQRPVAACHSSCSCEESADQALRGESSAFFKANCSKSKQSPPEEVKNLLCGNDFWKNSRKSRSKRKTNKDQIKRN